MRTLLGIIIVLVALLVGGFFFVYFNASHLAANAISHKAQVPVSIQTIDFKKDAFIIRNLNISNPKGARMPTALKTQTISVEAPYLNYFKDPIEIDKIDCNNVYVNIQLYNKEQTKGNWQTIIGNMQRDHLHSL